jgi:hypothetical protein
MIESLGIGVPKIDIGLKNQHLAGHGMSPYLEKFEGVVVQHRFGWTTFPQWMVESKLADG